MPDTQLYSIPMQRLTLTGRGTTFTFAVPDWQLDEDTTYALVLKSTDEKPVKWGNIQLNGVDKAPVAQNGFTFIDSPSDTTALPKNLYFSSIFGIIGANPLSDPALPGSYVTTIGMTETGSSAAPVSSTLTINIVSGVTPSLQLWYPNITGIAVGGTVSINPTISAWTGAVSYSLDGATALPNGLSLNSATGEISGTPTTATGTIVIPSIRVVDGSGASATAPLQIEILPFTPGLPATLTYPAEVTAYVGFHISIGPTVTNLTGAPTFSVQSPYVWSNSGGANNNALEIKVLFIPTMSISSGPQTYTGSGLSASVICSSGGTVSNVRYDGNPTLPINAGSYAVTADCAATGSYSSLTDASAGTFVISPATPTLSISNSPQTYTGSGLSATVSCPGGGTVSNVQYDGSNTVPTSAGSYAVTANCAASSNYAAVTNASAGTFVISAASQSINLVATPNAITVSGTSALSITGASGTGAVTYSLVSGPCTLAQNPAVLTGTGAGSCVVTATIAADPNHGSASSNPVTVTVAGPPIVTHVTAIPGAGFIKVVFDVVNSTSSASVVQIQTAVMYTATCTSTDGGVTVSATGPGSPLNVTGTTAGKSYTCSVTGTDGSGSSTSEPSNAVTPAPAPPPVNPIPTLSAWAQILMMLMMIGAVGWQTRRVIRQRSDCA